MQVAVKLFTQVRFLAMLEGTAQTRYSGTRTIETEQIVTQFRLRDYSRGNGIETYNLNGASNYSNVTDFVDNDNNWTSLEYNNDNRDNAALDLHWGTEMTYDYFFQRHNFNSFDGLGLRIRAYANWGNLNAQWDASEEVIRFGNGNTTLFDALTSLDVIAHEFGHGIDHFSSQLEYINESGALDEGISDIWGAMVELFAAPEKDTYLIGEDIMLNQVALRSMLNPKTFGNPDTYLGDNWFIGSGDAGGVHTNSGVIGYWFYLLAEGSSTTDGINDNGDIFSLTGIGAEKSADILFYAQHNYFTDPFMGYVVASNLIIQSAEDLYGTNSIEAIAVNNAWYAVGIGDLIINTEQLEGDATACYNINTTFTLTNVINQSVNWQTSSNLQIVSSNNTSIVVKASNSFTRSAGFVIANIDSQEIRKDIWVGRPDAPGKILGPTTVQYGALVNYTGSTDVDGATSYKWYLPYPYDPNATTSVDPTQWGIISGGNSRYLIAIVGPNDGLVQLMGVNKCGKGVQKT